MQGMFLNNQTDGILFSKRNMYDKFCFVSRRIFPFSHKRKEEDTHGPKAE